MSTTSLIMQTVLNSLFNLFIFSRFSDTYGAEKSIAGLILVIASALTYQIGESHLTSSLLSITLSYKDKNMNDLEGEEADKLTEMISELKKTKKYLYMNTLLPWLLGVLLISGN